MIYRIHPNVKEYLHFLVSADEVESKFGEGDRFHLEKKPKRYSNGWKPLEVEFFNNYDSKEKGQPDVSIWNGRMYVSSTVYESLKDMLDRVGEVLPVTHSGQVGYLINVLNTAEDVDALDKKLTLRNEWNELISLGFDEARVSEFPLFRTKQDSYRGIYCTDGFKQAVESSGFSGVTFTPDLADRPA